MARARCLAGLVRALDDARAAAYEATTDAAKLWTSPQVKAVVKAQPVCEQHDADTAEHERAANTGNARIARVVRERTAACAEARVDHTRHADAATAHADNAAGATISKASLSVSAPPRPAGQMLDASHAHNHPRQRKVPRKAREARDDG